MLVVGTKDRERVAAEVSAASLPGIRLVPQEACPDYSGCTKHGLGNGWSVLDLRLPAYGPPPVVSMADALVLGAQLRAGKRIEASKRELAQAVVTPGRELKRGPTITVRQVICDVARSTIRRTVKPRISQHDLETELMILIAANADKVRTLARLAGTGILRRQLWQRAQDYAQGRKGQDKETSLDRLFEGAQDAPHLVTDLRLYIDSHGDTANENADLYAALRNLKSEHARAVILVKVLEYKVIDAARIEGVSQSDMTYRVQTGLKELRKAMGAPEPALSRKKTNSSPFTMAA